MMPQFTPKELEQIFELCRKHGITQLLVKGLEVHFGPPTVPAKEWVFKAPNLPPVMTESVPSEGLPTEDDLLNWSNGLPLPSELAKAEEKIDGA